MKNPNFKFTHGTAIFVLILCWAVLVFCKTSVPEHAEPVELDWYYPDAGCYLTFATIESSGNGKTSFVTRDGNVFVADAEYDPNFPYMLTMYSNYTDDVTDDEICVVWAAVEGALG